jgi:hypothetical protein
VLYTWQQALTQYDYQIDNTNLPTELVATMLRQDWLDQPLVKPQHKTEGAENADYLLPTPAY